MSRRNANGAFEGRERWVQKARRLKPGRSGVLDDDALDQVRYVLPLVDRFFEVRVDVLPLEDLDRLRAVVKETGDGRSCQPIAFVLDPVDLRHETLEILEAPQVAEGLVERFASLDDQGRLLH